MPTLRDGWYGRYFCYSFANACFLQSFDETGEDAGHNIDRGTGSALERTGSRLPCASGRFSGGQHVHQVQRPKLNRDRATVCAWASVGRLWYLRSRRLSLIAFRLRPGSVIRDRPLAVSLKLCARGDANTPHYQTTLCHLDIFSRSHCELPLLSQIAINRGGTTDILTSRVQRTKYAYRPCIHVFSASKGSGLRTYSLLIRVSYSA